MNVKTLKFEYREFKIKVYQKIADYLILVLAMVQQAGDSRFELVYELGMKFDTYCVDREIYLD